MTYFLHPEPSHLSACVAPGLEQSAALSAACDVLTALGCVFAGEVVVARERPEWFAFLSDLERDVVRPPGLARDLAADPDVLELGFRHHEWGIVVLRRATAFKVGEPHPVEVMIHAGPLSLPYELWSAADRVAATRIEEWMAQLLFALSGPTEARYGAIGDEMVFPTPAALAAGTDSELWPGTWFWPPRLSALAPAEEEDLLSSARPGMVTRSPQGTLFRARISEAEPMLDEVAFGRVTSFLRRAIATPADSPRSAEGESE